MRRILRYFRARQFERDLAAEIESHLAEKTDDLTTAGMSRDVARAQARRQFGNATQIVEASREQWVYRSVEQALQDLRYTARTLWKAPAFTAAAILSLTLGIGAITLIFSVVDQVLLRALPYPQAEGLFAVWSRSAAHGAEPMHVSPADFYDWQSQSKAFTGLSAYSNWPMNLTNVPEPRRLEAELVSANLFSTLGVRARVGRVFMPDEDQEQSPSVVVISYHLWQSIGGSPQIVGQPLTLNGSPATVVGVMPADFGFPSRDTDAWVPLSLNAQNRASREGRWLSVIGRVREGMGLRDAGADMDLITRRLAAEYPATNKGWTASLVPLRDELVGKIRPILLMLQAAVSLLLLVTCSNLANLLLAKGTARKREIGLRAALGAGRHRIIRQLLIESLALAAVGGILGLSLAYQGLRLVRTFGDGLIPRAGEIHLSATVALFAVAMTLMTALLFGLGPALYVSRVDLREQIGSGARGTPRSTEGKRGLLIIVEVGLATVLLVGAGLLAGSLVHLLATSPGLRTEHLLSLRVTLPHSRYATNDLQNAFFDQILERVRAVPGVVDAAEVSETPLKGNNPSFEFVIDGALQAPADAPVQAGLRAMSVDYLRTAGVPLLKGRRLTQHDRAGAVRVAVVNETMARRYWNGSDPLGRRLRFKDDQNWVSVVGVVADTKHMGLKAEEGPVLYIPYAQKTQEWLAWTTLLVRTAGEPLDLVPYIRSAIWAVDKNQPIAEVSTVDQLLERSTAIPRFTTAVVAAISGIALVVALVGVYGLLAYTVAQQIPEIGIRLALGASPRQVSRLLLRAAMMRVVAGVLGGLLVAWWLTRLIGTLLFHVEPHDPATFAGVAILIVVSSLFAVLVPVRRAVQIDPMAALRAD